MTPPAATKGTACFGPYEVDVCSGEVRKFGTRIKLGEQPLRILVLLMERAGELVTREELRSGLWSDDTFVDFDHSLNSAVQRLRESLSDTAEKAQWIETVPRRGYRFVGDVQWTKVNGSEPAAAPAAEGPATEPAVAPSQTPGLQPAHGHSGWRLVPLALALLLAAAAIVKLVRSERLAKPTTVIRSLAVLPLENLSGDPNQDFFADGMTDELITMLAKNPGLRVVSRTTVMQYKKVRRPLAEIAHELGVDGILEGSVVRAGNRVHVNAQLIHGPSDTHIWAESYDRDLSDVGSLQSDLARTIAQQVGLTASVPPARALRHINPQAHDAYLLGRYYWFAEHYEKSKEYFEKAVALDPNYAAAWSGVADYYMARAASEEGSPQELIPQGEAAARKALALDDTSPEAHQSMAAVYYFGKWDWAGAERELTRTLALDPHRAETHHLYSYLLGTMGRTEEALREQRLATEIDPFARPWALGYALMRAHQFDAAISELRAKSQAQPSDIIVRQILFSALFLAGKEEEAAAEWEKNLTFVDPKEAVEQRTAFRKGGFNAVYERQMKQLKQAAGKEYVSQVAFAACAARLHRKEEALRYLERGYEEHETEMVRAPDHPEFDFLHSDARFQAILQKMGLPAAR